MTTIFKINSLPPAPEESSTVGHHLGVIEHKPGHSHHHHMHEQTVNKDCVQVVDCFSHRSSECDDVSYDLNATTNKKEYLQNTLRTDKTLNKSGQIVDDFSSSGCELDDY